MEENKMENFKLNGIGKFAGGDYYDVNINGVDAIELWNGYDTVTLQAGERRPLTIGTLWGGSDFNIELYLSNGSTNRVFYVDCTM